MKISLLFWLAFELTFLVHDIFQRAIYSLASATQSSDLFSDLLFTLFSHCHTVSRVSYWQDVPPASHYFCCCSLPLSVHMCAYFLVPPALQVICLSPQVGFYLSACLQPGNLQPASQFFSPLFSVHLPLTLTMSKNPLSRLLPGCWAQQHGILLLLRNLPIVLYWFWLG